HPNAFRLGVFRPWEANWFANPKDYTKMLHEDLEMRRVILARLRNAGIAKIETERSSNAQLTVTIHTAKPGIVIGKGGSSVDQLREDLEKRFGNRVRISIQEIKQPELDAQLVAENIASQIERRISYKDQISPVQRRLAAIQEETVPIAEQVTPLAEIIEAVAQPQAAQIEVATPDSAAKVAPRRTRTATAKVEEKAAAPARPKAAPK